MDLILFYAFGSVAVLASLLVIGQRNPMHSVLLLIVSFGALAALYVLLDSPLVAVTQIIIYAGAIMVLFLFVVMLLNLPREEPAPMGRLAFGAARPVGVVLAVALGVELVWALSRVREAWFEEAGAGAAASLTSVRAIGIELFTKHAFAFEATSVLILVAMVGAVVLARKEDREAPEARSGRAGMGPRARNEDREAPEARSGRAGVGPRARNEDREAPEARSGRAGVGPRAQGRD